MKLLVLFGLFALAVAAPKDGIEIHPVLELDQSHSDVSQQNILINALVHQLFTSLRRMINNGMPALGIPVLDPLHIKEFNLNIPAGLINLQLDLKDVHADGFGDFQVRSSNLNLHDLTFDIDIYFPIINARAGFYDLVGDLFGAIPLYGKGNAVFVVDGFSFRCKLHLKQSEDRKSILIDRIENPGFDFPALKSDLTGAIGGGRIDDIVNAMIEEVIIGYINRFSGAIAQTAASIIPSLLNSFLDGLDTWRYIAPLIPRN